MLDIHICSTEETALVFALRTEVFVEEQCVPVEEELDAEDSIAVHIIAKDGGCVVGCGRIIFNGNDAHIGRLAVKRDYRGKGVGMAVCKYITALCLSHGCDSIWLNSQLHAVPFYEKAGFCAVGKVFMDAGIEHIRMVL